MLLPAGLVLGSEQSPHGREQEEVGDIGNILPTVLWSVCTAGVWSPRIHAANEGWVARVLLERRSWGLRGLGALHRL